MEAVFYYLHKLSFSPHEQPSPVDTKAPQPFPLS